MLSEVPDIMLCQSGCQSPQLQFTTQALMYENGNGAPQAFDMISPGRITRHC